EKNVGLGHRRLSIIDISSSANQPMSDPTDRYKIVFNGEIFNFNSLKEKLIGKGVHFTTHSDTEVLLQLYILEGRKFLSQLNGFFAFAIYDRQDQTLFVARDRYGIKPFFYYRTADHFLFSSELKG